MDKIAESLYQFYISLHHSTYYLCHILCELVLALVSLHGDLQWNNALFNILNL